MRPLKSCFVTASILGCCSLTFAQTSPPAVNPPIPPPSESLHVERNIPNINAVLFVSPKIGGESFGLFRAPDGTAAGIPVLETKQAMEAGYRAVTLGDMIQFIDGYAKAIQEQQKQINDLSSDYNALVARFNRLAAVNSTAPATSYTPPQTDDKRAMRLMLFQSLVSRTAPQSPPVRVQVTDCKAYPASCLH
jgi:hypothetical protein